LSTGDARPKDRCRVAGAFVLALTCFVAGGMIVACIFERQEASARPAQTKGDTLWNVMKNAPFHPPVDALSVKAAIACGQAMPTSLPPPDKIVPTPTPLTATDLDHMDHTVLRALRDRDEPETFRNYPEGDQLNGTFHLMRSGPSSGHFVETYCEPFFKEIRATVNGNTLTLSLVVPLRGDASSGTIEMAPSMLTDEDFGRLWRVAFNSARQQFDLKGYNLILRINPVLPKTRLHQINKQYTPPKNPQCILVGMMRQDYNKIRWDCNDDDDFIQVHSNVLQIIRARLDPIP